MPADTRPVYLSPEQVCDLLPGMTPQKLEYLRGAGQGPSYFKPTLKTVLYREDQVLEWVAGSAVNTKQ